MRGDLKKMVSFGKVKNWLSPSEEIKLDTRRALIGGLMAAVTTLLGAWTVGEASGSETFVLLSTSLETTRSFSGTITLALGNILALMLTLLSLSTATNMDLKWTHYLRIKQISWVTACVLSASILIYLLFNIPLSEADDKSLPWFRYLYYATLASSSLLGGALISIVMMIYNAAKDIIMVLSPHDKGEHLIYTEEDEETQDESSNTQETPENKKHPQSEGK